MYPSSLQQSEHKSFGICSRYLCVVKGFVKKGLIKGEHFCIDTYIFAHNR